MKGPIQGSSRDYRVRANISGIRRVGNSRVMGQSCPLPPPIPPLFLSPSLPTSFFFSICLILRIFFSFHHCRKYFNKSIHQRLESINLQIEGILTINFESVSKICPIYRNIFLGLKEDKIWETIGI